MFDLRALNRKINTEATNVKTSVPQLSNFWKTFLQKFFPFSIMSVRDNFFDIASDTNVTRHVPRRYQLLPRVTQSSQVLPIVFTKLFVLPDVFCKSIVVETSKVLYGFILVWIVGKKTMKMAISMLTASCLSILKTISVEK